MCNQCNSIQNNHAIYPSSGAEKFSFGTSFTPLEMDDGQGLIKRGVYEPISVEENSDEPNTDKALIKYKEDRKNDRENNRITFERLDMQRELVSGMRSERVDNRSISLSQCFLHPITDRGNGLDGFYEPDWALVVRDRFGNTHFERVAKCNCGCCVYCGVKKAMMNEKNLLKVIDKAIQEDLGIFMLTFNARHFKKDDPSVVFQWEKEAVQLTMKDNRVKRLLESKLGKVDGMGLYRGEPRPAIGCFTAIEAPFGKNGYHPHYHKLLITKRKANKKDIKAIQDRIWEVYNGYFERLSGRKLSKQTGVHFQALKGENAKQKAAKYFVKNGLAKELTAYANKNTLSDEEIGLFKDDFFTVLKSKELNDIKTMVDNLISQSSITHLGMIDLCIYFKKMAKVDEFKEYALKQFNHWKHIYCLYISTFYGVQMYRFSNGLKAWAGLPEDEDSEEEIEESSDLLIVEPFSVSIEAGQFSLLTGSKQEANFLYIASFPDINGGEMSEIVSKLGDIYHDPLIKNKVRKKVVQDYFALLLYERKLVDFDLTPYRNVEVNLRKDERESLIRDFALKFESDKNKRRTARPVVYNHPLYGYSISREEAEIFINKNSSLTA